MQELELEQGKTGKSEQETQEMENQLAGMGLYATWKAIKFEISGVLRNVLDGVLKESGVSEAEVSQNTIT